MSEKIILSGKSLPDRLPTPYRCLRGTTEPNREPVTATDAISVTSVRNLSNIFDGIQRPFANNRSIRVNTSVAAIVDSRYLRKNGMSRP